MAPVGLTSLARAATPTNDGTKDQAGSSAGGPSAGTAVAVDPPGATTEPASPTSPKLGVAKPDDETRLPLSRPAPAPPPEAARGPGGVVASPIAPIDRSHKDQLGLALLPGSGYRMIVPYKDLTYCGQLGNRVCTGRIPWFLDVEPSYGLAEGWDLIVTLRFGLEKDFARHRTFAAMPGFRYWVDRDTALRLFTTVQFVYDDTNQNGNRDEEGNLISDIDLGVRNANGFMYDVLRNFSVYFQFGETIGMKRWFSFAMDGGFGVQARVP